jgi:hypothetical protein
MIDRVVLAPLLRIQASMVDGRLSPDSSALEDTIVMQAKEGTQRAPVKVFKVEFDRSQALPLWK